MKYEICSTYVFDNPSELIEEYPCLNDFGFTVETVETPYSSRIRDENGKNIWQESTRMIEKAYVEIRDLEDLSKFIEAVGNPLVIGEGRNLLNIEIYDGYRE